MGWTIGRQRVGRLKGALAEGEFSTLGQAIRSFSQELPHILLAGEGSARARALWPMRRRISAEFRNALRSGFHTGFIYASGEQRPPVGRWSYLNSEIQILWVRIPHRSGKPASLPGLRVRVSVTRMPLRKGRHLPPLIGSQAPWSRAAWVLLPELRERRRARARQRMAWISQEDLQAELGIHVQRIHPIPRAPGIALAFGWSRQHGFRLYIFTRSGKGFMSKQANDYAWRDPPSTGRMIGILQEVLETKIPKELWRTEALERVLVAAAMEGRISVV